ncbi:MAG: flagellar biosynthetic protein FliR [Angelakisella sp.]
MTLQFDGFQTFLLVFVRMVSMLAFQPLLARKNLPRRVVAGLALCLTILLAGIVTPAPDYVPMDMALAIAREVFVGFVCGFVFQIFYYMLFFVGDFMDMQFGMSMAKVFDPGTNLQISISGNVLNIIFVLYFFATGSHLVMLRLFASSYQIIPAGVEGLNLQISGLMAELFIAAFGLAIKLLLPFAVAEFTLEVAMGILMRLIPQIHVFVINMQLKIAMGMLLLLVFATPIASFVDNYILIMLENMQRALFGMVT